MKAPEDRLDFLLMIPSFSNFSPSKWLFNSTLGFFHPCTKLYIGLSSSAEGNVIRWEIRFICIILKAFPQPAELSICNTLSKIGNLLFYIVGYLSLSNPRHVQIIFHWFLIPQHECFHYFHIYLEVLTSVTVCTLLFRQWSSPEWQVAPQTFWAFNTKWNSEIRRGSNIAYCSLARGTSA